MQRAANTMSIILRMVTPSDRNVRKFVAALIDTARLPRSITISEVSGFFAWLKARSVRKPFSTLVKKDRPWR